MSIISEWFTFFFVHFYSHKEIMSWEKFYFHLSHHCRRERSGFVIKPKTQAPVKKFITLLLSSRTQKCFSFFCVRSTQFFRHSINSMRPWHHNRFLSHSLSLLPPIFLSTLFSYFIFFIAFAAFCAINLLCCIVYCIFILLFGLTIRYLCNLSCFFYLFSFSFVFEFARTS